MASQFDMVVAQMMAVYGGAAILNIPTEGGSYVDGEFVPAATLHKNVKVLLDEYPQANAGDKQGVSDLILAGDKRCLMQPLEKMGNGEAAYEVRANKDTLTISGTEWKIIRMKQINPSGFDCVIFELHIRK